MADPVTLTVVSSLLTAGTAVAGGMEAQAQADYQAAIYRNQAEVAAQNIQRESLAGQVRQQQSDLEAAQMLGRQAAEQGASGLSSGSKSFLQSRKAAKLAARQDALNIRDASAVTIASLKNQQSSALASAKAAKIAGKNSLLMSYFDAAGSLIGSATTLGKRKKFTPVPTIRPGNLTL